MGPAVFKTVEGAKVPWRVRFPSASAKAHRFRLFQPRPSITMGAIGSLGPAGGRDGGA